MKAYLTDLKMSKRLMEAGVEKESKWSHCLASSHWTVPPGWALCLKVEEGLFYCPENGKEYIESDLAEIIPAYLLDELLEMVEEDWEVNIKQITIANVSKAILWQKGKRKGRGININLTQALPSVTRWKKEQE